MPPKPSKNIKITMFLHATSLSILTISHHRNFSTPRQPRRHVSPANLISTHSSKVLYANAYSSSTTNKAARNGETGTPRYVASHSFLSSHCVHGSACSCASVCRCFGMAFWRTLYVVRAVPRYCWFLGS